MPRISGVRQRRHQPFWDTLVRATGPLAAPLLPQTRLFGNANIGNLALTNLQVAGQFAADQTYIVLAMRCWLYFDGTNARTNYTQVISQLYFTMTAGDQPQFQAPCWYFPAGGGLYGVSNVAAVFNNGYPSQGAILKLARPIAIPVRQNISVAADFFPVGAVNALTLLNAGAADDQKIVLFMIDGLQTRDVQ